MDELYLLIIGLGLLAGWGVNNCIRWISLKEGDKDLSKLPLVAAVTAIVFLSLYYKYGLTLQFAAFAYLMSVLIIVFVIDIGYRIIPNGLVVAGLTGGGLLYALNFRYPLKYYGDEKWWTPILGMIAVPAFFLLIALMGVLIYRSSEVMGMGDIKIFAPIGLLLGWKMAMVSLFISILLGGTASLVILIFKWKNRKDAVPFAPFIVTGTYISILWGWDIFKWFNL